MTSSASEAGGAAGYSASATNRQILFTERSNAVCGKDTQNRGGEDDLNLAVVDCSMHFLGQEWRALQRTNQLG